MQVNVSINCDNAAFYDGDGFIYANEELARIFSKLSNQIKSGVIADIPVNIRDINGNTVGSLEVVPN